MKRLALATVLVVPLAAPSLAQTGASANPSSPAAPAAAPKMAGGTATDTSDKSAPAAKAAPPPGAAASPSTSAPAPTSAADHPAAPGTPAAAVPPAAKTAPAAPAVTLADKALAVKPGHYRLDPDEGKITWSVNHRGFSTYAGQFAAVAADLTIDPKDVAHTTLTATVDTTSVGTLNPKLDAELEGDDWFDSKTYKQASFKATAVTVTGPQTARIDGELTLRGKTVPIVISATFNNAGIDPVDKQYTVGFDAAAIIRRSAFGIAKYLPFIGDNVTLRLEGEFKPAQP